LTFDIAERIVRAVWRFHFRIPPGVYWVVLFVGTTLAFFVPGPATWWTLLASGIGVAGILRWRWHRRHPLLVIPLFMTFGSDDSRARRAQQLILESLSRALTPEEQRFVHAIPVVIGPNDTRFAEQVRQRVDALYVVHGRVDERNDGGWSVYAGVAAGSEEEVLHLDWHTRDLTPGKATWDIIVDRLTPARNVPDELDPLLFTGELAALVQALGGRVALAFGDTRRAERLLRGTLERASRSTSHVIDGIRVDLARALMGQDRRDEALAILRERAKGGDASPQLLRTLARFLGRQPGDFIHSKDEAADAEAIAALRQAAADRSDPARPMTLYNLTVYLGLDNPETVELLEEAAATSRLYRRAWYVRRARGALHWHRGQDCLAQDPVAAKREFAEAAKWYSAALRSRPKLRLRSPRYHGWRFWKRYPPSPILLANAADAHCAAGHHVRCGWLLLRVARRRAHHLRRARRFARRSAWLRAYANYDFARIGSDDDLDVFATVMVAVSLQQIGEAEAALREWQAILHANPVALLHRAFAVHDEELDLEAGVPGDETTDIAAVTERLTAMGVLDGTPN
jgi:tetratricopeptide (TPR) repeat protein